LGYTFRLCGKAVGRGALLILALALVLVLAGGGLALAEEETPSPHLPILLLNGAIYPQHYDLGAFPASFRVDGYPPGETALYLVQCKGLVRETWIEDLKGIGGEPRGYLPYNTLLVAMDGMARSRLGELGFVAWSGLYQPYFKISPALQLRLDQGGEVVVLAELYSARFLKDTLDALAGLPVEVLGSEPNAWCAVIALRMPVETLEDVASLPAVEWMELCTAGTLPGVAAGSAASQQGGGLVPAAAGGVGISAAAGGGGEKVGLGDTGLGTGGPRGIPAALKGDVLALYSLRGDSGGDVNGHGTAVAGSLVGVGSEEAGSGLSPPCALVAYATGYGLGCPPRPLSLYSLLESGYAEGTRVYLSGSVPEGRESLGAYGIYASQRDAFTWSNPDMALVEAAGNEGTDADGDGVVDKGSLLGGATAKNTLSIGGCESPAEESDGVDSLSYRQLEEFFSGRFPSPPLRDDSSVGVASGMAAFSSRGPTQDGRIKPDLVAPATYILTAASGGGEATPGVLASGEAGYVRAYGTSMAAAQVAASLAAMRRLLAQEQGTGPSAALLKAFLVNGATDMAPGQYGAQNPEIPPAPNVVEGWGRMDLETSARKDSWIRVLDDSEGLHLGESRVFKIEVKSGKQLRVTLAWTDYPSLPETRLRLVNDLDLRLVDPEGNSYYPNGRSSRDPLNNVERVNMDISGKLGDYTIEITAWNVPFSPQPFALVAQVL